MLADHSFINRCWTGGCLDRTCQLVSFSEWYRTLSSHFVCLCLWSPCFLLSVCPSVVCECVSVSLSVNLSECQQESLKHTSLFSNFIYSDHSDFVISFLLLIQVCLSSVLLSHRNSGSNIPKVQGGRLWKSCGLHWWRDSDRTGCEEEDGWEGKKFLIVKVSSVIPVMMVKF